MRNLVRRALDKLTGPKADRKQSRPKAAKKGASKARPAESGPALPDDSAPNVAGGTPTAAPTDPADGAAPASARNSLIEQALAIRRKQSRIFDKLNPEDRRRLQAIAARQFQAALSRPKAPASGEPGGPTGKDGTSRPPRSRK